MSALPTFYMCALKIPISIFEQIDKYRKHSPWNHGDINRKGGCLVAWENATRPKHLGGLGIQDLRAHNTSLLVKHLHKFYNRLDIPWVSLTWNAFYSRPIPPHHKRRVGAFWWRDIMSLSDHFFMMASCSSHEGVTSYFWRDSWNLGVL
jgi:hypothetical protein